MAQTPKTYNQYTADGQTRQFAITFPYRARTEVFVTVDSQTVLFDFITGSTIEVRDIPVQGSIVRVYRDTLAYNTAHRFQLDAPFLPEYVDENNAQLLYAVQETNDQLNAAKEGLNESLVVERAQRQSADDAILRASQEGDAHIQEQLQGNVPLEASAFSPVSWHAQVISSTVEVPPGKNAWSFGPNMTIADGQAVVVPESSVWTIAEGRVREGVAGAIFTEATFSNGHYTLTVHPAYSSVAGYSDGLQLRFRTADRNTGTTTVNLGTLGTKRVLTPTQVELPVDFIRSDVETLITYNADLDAFIASRAPEFVQNENGYGVRYENGWAECVTSVVADITVDVTTGALFRSGEYTTPYPFTFAATPRGWGMMHNGTFSWVSGRAANASSGRLMLYATVSRSGDSAKGAAVGYWYI